MKRKRRSPGSSASRPYDRQTDSAREDGHFARHASSADKGLLTPTVALEPENDAEMICTHSASVSFLRMARDPLNLSREAIADIGANWRATDAEQQLLDFKETPDTALTPPQRAKRNMGKERKAFLTAVAEAAACLANADGGVIAIGVRDRATSRAEAIQGADPGTYPLDAIRLAVHHGTVPPLTVDAHEHEAEGRRFVLVRVPRGAVVHATAAGTYKRRVADRCLPVGEAQMRALQASRGQYDWSARPSRFDEKDISVAALARAAERLRAVGRDELAERAEADHHQFLADCDLLVEGKLRNAAVLMYGNERALRGLVADWGAVLVTAPSSGSEGAVLMRREDAATRPLVPLLDDLLARLATLASVETIRIGAAELPMVDYDTDVVRELLANAFAHRDWEQPGVIEIAHSPDELRVSSPGDLLPTLRPDRLLHETAQRNRTLAREIARLRLGEGAGLGFDRVWRLLASVGKDPPRIEAGLRFSVVVAGGRGDSVFVRFLQGPEFPERRLASDLDVLLTLSTLRRRRTVTAQHAAPILQRDERSVQATLARMESARLLEPTRSSARRQWPSYRLAPAVIAALRGALTYRVDSIDSDDIKLIRHLKRHRRIANEDVRAYLDCDVATARNRLARLRAKALIDFDPEGPKRGPNVVYVATAKVDDVGL